MQIAHTRLLVVNFAECYRFYRDVLHLKPMWGDESGGYASFKRENENEPALALFNRQAMSDVLHTTHLPLNPSGQDRCMLIIAVEDVDSEVLKMKQEGVPFELDPTSFPDWGYRAAYLRDPDGNLIEILSSLPADKWSDGLREADQQYSS